MTVRELHDRLAELMADRAVAAAPVVAWVYDNGVETLKDIRVCQKWEHENGDWADFGNLDPLNKPQTVLFLGEP